MLRKSGDKAGATTLLFSLNQIRLQIALHFLSYLLKNYGRQWNAPLTIHLISKCERSEVLPRRCTAWKCPWHRFTCISLKHRCSHVYLYRGSFSDISKSVLTTPTDPKLLANTQIKVFECHTHCLASYIWCTHIKSCQAPYHSNNCLISSPQLQ